MPCIYYKDSFANVCSMDGKYNFWHRSYPSWLHAQLSSHTHTKYCNYYMKIMKYYYRNLFYIAQMSYMCELVRVLSSWTHIQPNWSHAFILSGQFIIILACFFLFSYVHTCRIIHIRSLSVARITYANSKLKRKQKACDCCP